MFFRSSFMSEQIPVSAGIKICLIAFFGLLTDGQGDCTVWVLMPDRRHDFTHFIIRKIWIFSTLQNKGPESQTIPLLAAGQDLFFRKAVPHSLCIASADPAVIAVILTVIGKFNQSPDIHLITIILAADGIRLLCQTGSGLWRIIFQQFF